MSCLIAEGDRTEKSRPDGLHAHEDGRRVDGHRHGVRVAAWARNAGSAHRADCVSRPPQSAGEAGVAATAKSAKRLAALPSWPRLAEIDTGGVTLRGSAPKRVRPGHEVRGR